MVFTKFDRDADGGISFDEFVTLLQALKDLRSVDAISDGLEGEGIQHARRNSIAAMQAANARSDRLLKAANKVRAGSLAVRAFSAGKGLRHLASRDLSSLEVGDDSDGSGGDDDAK